MIFQGEGFGVVSQLRTCLAGSFFGSPIARVDSASDADEFLDGQSKLEIPYIVCVPGVVNNKSQSEPGATALTEMLELLEVYVVFDAKPDAIGRKATDFLHAVRLDLQGCLHGWNPFLAAKCKEPPVPYGYCAKNFLYSGDIFIEQDNERVVRVFDFHLQATITAQAQGFGPSNPLATESFDRIRAEFKPVDTNPVDHPFPVADLDLT